MILRTQKKGNHDEFISIFLSLDVPQSCRIMTPHQLQDY